ncbi:MAG TPA: thymidine phosphorylase [Planctomycetaceae bacterium]|nr:thymidine phosphorylase [Planctomycetaceae bacterium]
MLTTAIIAKKRDGQELTRDEIAFIVDGITHASIPDYQIASWAMAVLCRGMTTAETAALTDCMLDSGDRLRPATDRPRVDKHSTGGLGDKVSLILAPLLASIGLDVPMLSGRGLGITGGTLDKLESYEGFRADLSEDEIDQQLRSIGCVITGTTKQIAPADRKLYALRDATATVPSVGLITGSIMSKKLAATLNALVLDVKFGSGAFMQSIDQARELLSSLVATGKRMGVRTTALLSDMNQPLGEMVGNACEVNEAVEVLRGGGPNDVRELTLQLCAQLVASISDATNHNGDQHDVQSAYQRLADELDSGRPLERYREMITAQGGRFLDHLSLHPEHVVTASTAGWVAAVDGQAIGNTVISLKGGRARMGDPIDSKSGLKIIAKVGQEVAAGQPLAHVYAADGSERAVQSVRDAIQLSDSPVAPLTLMPPVEPN